MPCYLIFYKLPAAAGSVPPRKGADAASSRPWARTYARGATKTKAASTIIFITTLALCLLEVTLLQHSRNLPASLSPVPCGPCAARTGVTVMAGLLARLLCVLAFAAAGEWHVDT